jgi:hypothetical protein
MENKDLNSCLMLAVNLDCPISLKVMFDEPDLKDTGVELDSHITLLYAQGRELDRTKIIPDLKEILGEDGYWKLVEKIQDPHEIPVLDVFDLGSFENDSDYIVLKLKPESIIYEPLQKINKGLRLKYDVSSDFDSFTPHVSLAELRPGMAGKYLESEELKNFLRDTVISLEDIMISYGASNEPEDRKQYFLTGFHSVDRYFRLNHLKSE